MTKTDIATRVYNHSWKLDPIIRSLIDTDFYKLLMLQMIWKLYPDVDATFSLINRATSVRLAEAASRLVHTDAAVAEIAEHVGWRDPTHFIRRFRRASGLTPAAWRREHRRGHRGSRRR